jgi:hypothetical protein
VIPCTADELGQLVQSCELHDVGPASRVRPKEPSQAQRLVSNDRTAVSERLTIANTCA